MPGGRMMPRRPTGIRLKAGVVAVLLYAAPPVDSPVADAAMRGDAETVQSLIARGADVNVPQGDGMTALHWAADRADGAMVGILLDAGAEVAAVTRIGSYTPLHLASRSGGAEAVEALLEAEADPGIVTTTGAVTPMHFAAASGSAGAIAALARHSAVVDAVESEWGQTPLMFAAANNRLAAVETLLALGADLTLRTRVIDIEDRAAIDREAGEARDQVLERFREEAEDPRFWRPTPEQVRAAVRVGHELQASRTQAESNSEEPEDPDGFPGYTGLVGAQGGMTALLHAVREGHAETALVLLDAGADIDGVTGGDHTSPLLLATINGHFDLAMTLLERGADPRTASDAGATPLFGAINTYWAPKSRYPQQQAYQQQQIDYLELMEALLEAGADPNVRLTKHLWYMSYTFDLLRVDTQGATPFWRAAYGTDVEAMKLLVAYGADPSIPTVKPPERRRRGEEEAEDPSGLPPVPVGGPAVFPIHAASGVGYGEGFAGNSHRHAPNGWLPSVRYLVEELGADINARDHNGYNALHHAAARGDVELISYLAERGADVMAVSRRGQTTADMANGPFQRTQPFPEALALLEGLGAHNNNNCLSC